jgi:alkaline phosphatase D
MKKVLLFFALSLLALLVACQPAAKVDTAVRGKTDTTNTAHLAPQEPQQGEEQDDEDDDGEGEEPEIADEFPVYLVEVTHGPLSGEVSDTAVTLWARGNMEGTLAFTLVPIATVYTPTLTTELTETIEITVNLGITDTVVVTDTAEITDTIAVTDTAEITDTVAVTDTAEITDTIAVTDTAEITDTVAVTDTAEITDTVAVTDTAEITDTVAVTDTAEITDTVAVTDTAEITDTIAVTDTIDLSEIYDGIAPITQFNDYTGQVRVEGLQPSTLYSYTVVLLTEFGSSEARTGTFTTAPAATTAAPFDFVFGGCLGGQGYCRTEEGWVIFDQMAATEPDFFLLIGDGVYVDTACMGEGIIPGAEGPFWELDGFRTRYKYHLEDAPYVNFLNETPVYVTWDDHEVINDFGGPDLQRINPRLFMEGFQAFSEYWPHNRPVEDPTQMYRNFSYGAHAEFFVLDTRSYRDPNVDWDPNPTRLTPKTMLGAAQFAWLQESLAASEATWKFIVTSVPLSYPTGFPEPQVNGRDGWANYTEPSGYETELLSLIFFLESQGIQNVVFLSGDTHWPYAISYDPDRNGEANFHEFASSPLSAITLSPTANADPTLNPTVLFAEGEFAGDTFNFGRIALDEAGELTLNFYNLAGEQLYELTLSPE